MFDPILVVVDLGAVASAVVGIGALLALAYVVKRGAQMVLEMIRGDDDDPYKDPDEYIWPNKYDDDCRF